MPDKERIISRLELIAYIEKNHKDKAYRPVVVSVLLDSEGNVLLTETPIKNAKTPWSFPQGGIDKGESIEDAMGRELDEELGIKSQDVINTQHGIMIEEVDAEEGRVDKRGFTKGKAYIVSVGNYVGNKEFEVDPEEVVEAKWLSPEEAVNYLKKARPEKAEILIGILNRVLQTE